MHADFKDKNSVNLQFSVVIPCHNNADTIERAIDSALGQTLSPLEIIVILDGCTDRSEEIVAGYGGIVTYQAVQVRNAAAARNIGIRQAHGEWIGFLDADDYWYPNHLERSADVVGQSEDVGILNHFHRMTANGSVYQPYKNQYPLSTKNGYEAEEYIKLMSRGMGFVGMSACSVKRERALAVNGFDEAFIRSEDIEFWLRVIHGHTWAYDSTATSIYFRSRSGSLSSEPDECVVYRLQVLMKNKELYPTAAMQQALRAQARWALFHATLLPDDSPFQAVARTGHQYLTPQWRWVARMLTASRVLRRLFGALYSLLLNAREMLVQLVILFIAKKADRETFKTV